MVLLRRVGKTLRDQRLELRISQEALAAMAGLDRTYVSQLERGIGNPSLRTLSLLAAALKIELSDLLASRPRGE